jgi:hypothetical protein
MYDRIAELLIETEAAFFAAHNRHQQERSSASRSALQQAQQALDEAKHEAEHVLFG